jgi:hypothetical protein
VNTGGPGAEAGTGTMLRYSFVFAVGLLTAGSAGASTWAEGLFGELSKDFGSVPRGPAQKHDFRVFNNTRSPVNISSVRVSCGCVSASAYPRTYLKPGEETWIRAQMDTTRFIGAKSVTIYVQFDRPNFEEVRLWVQANGRNDFAMSPEMLSFGQIKRGTSPASSVSITFYGNQEAAIVSAKGESNYVVPTVVESRRTESEVVYTVTAKLRADTPVGKWYTDVWVKTNLATVAQMRVPLTVEIESPLTVSPAVVSLGSLKPDGESERRVIVRGVQPFKIVGVRGADDHIVVRDNSTEAREVHVLTIKFKPDAGNTGSLDRTLRVVTDLKEDNEIDFKINAVVQP